MSYATVSQLKNELKIASSDTSQDARLQDLLDWITGWINTYTKRTFGTGQTISDETHDLLDDNKVWLSNTDVTTVTAVKLGQNPNALTTLDPTAYAWNKLGRLVIYQFPYTFPDIPRTLNRDFYLDYVHVDYTYGTAVPKDIEGACVEAAAKVYRNTNIEREEIGDYKLMYQRTPNGPADVFGDMGVLDAYRIRGV